MRAARGLRLRAADREHVDQQIDQAEVAFDLQAAAVVHGRERVDPTRRVAGERRWSAARQRIRTPRCPRRERDRERRKAAVPITVAHRELDRPTQPGLPRSSPGSEPEDRAEVDALGGAGRAPGPLVAPAGKLAEDRH